MDAEETARAYYDALDDHDYERLRSLLAPGFSQHRPDRTFESPDAFVAFMRDERPEKTTTHEVGGLYCDRRDGQTARTRRVAVEGTVRTATGDDLVRFVDVFTVTADGVTELRTYTR